MLAHSNMQSPLFSLSHWKGLTMRRITSFALVVLVLITVSGCVAQAQNGDRKEIRFTVSMPKPHTHLFEVEIHIKNTGTAIPQQQTLIMPVWQPGSYLVREFERHVQDFAASNADGKPVAWEKINKNSWRIATGPTREWRVAYRVYANELSVRTSELNSDHAFWNNTNLLMYPEGGLHYESILKVSPHNNWKVATGLPPVPGEPNTFRAPDFDVLTTRPLRPVTSKSSPSTLKACSIASL